MIWTPNDWLNKFYSFCVAALVGIISRCALAIEACCSNQPNKSKLALFKPLIHFYIYLKQLNISNKKGQHFSYKDGCCMGGGKHIEAFRRKADFGYR